MIRKAIPPLLLPILLALAFVLPFQGTRPLWGTDEGRYSAVAVEMLDSGDWLLPHRHPDHPHLSKPPLTYWAMASSMAVFGKNVWALRLPSALAFVLTIGCAFTIGKRLQPERPWWPAVVVAGTAMIFLASNAVSTDPLLSAFETLGMTGVILAWRGESDRIARRGAWITGLGFGLAFLTKGPPGLVPLLPTLWFYWRNRADFRANPFNWKTLAIWAPIALAWFITVIVVYPDLHLLRYFLGYETYGRIFTDTQNRHPQWYGWIVAFGPVALVGALPWTLLVAWDAFRRGGEPQTPANDADRAVSRFLLLWLFVSLAVFCVARSRLILYVLPLLVPFALWTAQRTRHLAVTRIGKILLALWFALLIGAKAYAGYVDFGKDASALSENIRVQVHDPIREIVFVNETALYGVRVYLDMPVLRVNYDASADPAVDMSLAQAFAQRRPQRLWLVHMNTVDRFMSDVAHDGGHARQVVSYAHYRGFLIDRVSPLAMPLDGQPDQAPTAPNGRLD
ncbi:MAG TPA: glycosyltransferase family 39 protein [Xanthomonadaceae bacterium]|jgi:4-amino-4-deoxy-L-arabinose transferase-like glycosyltransferase|nr:glycosyltransferase family 39 protein [Xanthomonadaceae bacterium]